MQQTWRYVVTLASLAVFLQRQILMDRQLLRQKVQQKISVIKVKM